MGLLTKEFCSKSAVSRSAVHGELGRNSVWASFGAAITLGVSRGASMAEMSLPGRQKVRNLPVNVLWGITKI